jgi:hypothetical protein
MAHPVLRLSVAQQQLLPETVREHLVAVYAEVRCPEAEKL